MREAKKLEVRVACLAIALVMYHSYKDPKVPIYAARALKDLGIDRQAAIDFGAGDRVLYGLKKAFDILEEERSKK